MVLGGYANLHVLAHADNGHPLSRQCRERAPIWMHRHTLGMSFSGHMRLSVSLMCDRQPKAVRVTGDHPPNNTPFWSVLYGDCPENAQTECAYPLEIQSWPECARNLASHEPSADQMAAPVATWYQIRGYPRLPAVEIESGWVEVYAGTTTVVVFAESNGLARRAARAVAPVAAREGRGLSADRLRARALRRSGRCGA